LLPKEDVLQEKSFSTDASAKPEPDCHPLKLEPRINVDGGMFFFLVHLCVQMKYQIFKSLEECSRNSNVPLTDSLQARRLENINFTLNYHPTF